MKRWVGLVASIVFIVALTASVPASASLIAYWPMDDGTGTTVADVTGNGNDGIVLGGTPSWVPGHTGGTGDYALDFTSNSTYVQIDNSAPPNWPAVDAMTIDFWVRAPFDTANQYKQILLRHEYLSNQGWKIEASAGVNPDGSTYGSIGMRVWTPDGGNGGTGWMGIWNADIWDNSWHHVVWTVGDGIITGVFDGVNKANYTYAGTFDFSQNGKLVFPKENAFKGALDDIKIYDEVIIPEPGSLLLLGTGLLGLVSLVRRKRG